MFIKKLAFDGFYPLFVVLKQNKNRFLTTKIDIFFKLLVVDKSHQML